MIQIQERDRKLLRLCYEQQFITLEHAEYAFQGTVDRVTRRRVAELEQAGYLIRKNAKSVTRRYYFRLTPAGHAIAAHESPYELPGQPQINLNQFDHDAIVTSVRQRLERVWDARFEPERSLKAAEYGYVPDGVFRFQDGAQVALEVENSEKGVTRLTDLLRRWSQIDQLLLVLYVPTQPHVESLLKRAIQDAPADPPLAVVAWENLKAGYPEVWTRRGYCNLFDRRSL